MKSCKLAALLSSIAVFAIAVAPCQLALAGDRPKPLMREFFLNARLANCPSFSKSQRSDWMLPQGEPVETKSVFKAVLLSLILPGMGELYSDGFSSGKYFLVAESGLWLTFTSFELYGHWLQNDARSFAASHASAMIEGKNDQFFINLGNFTSVYDYNEKKLRDRDLRDVYDPSGAYFWQWDSDQSRARFRDMRVKSDGVLNNVQFVVGAIVVNHLASAINAARLTIKRNKEASSTGWLIESRLLGAFPKVDGVMLTFRKDF